MVVRGGPSEAFNYEPVVVVVVREPVVVRGGPSLQKAISLHVSLVIRVCCSPYGLSRGPFRCAPVAFAHHTASLEGHLDAPLSRLLTIRPL